MNSLLDWLDSFSGSPWFYLVIFVIALLDSVIPVVPSETTVIVGGIAAGQGDLAILLVIL
ncbi:MAG: DedA family protein, partial [Actinomycetia bacterium]|nr:DedA family protein [Actinomycetes bacterium]